MKWITAFILIAISTACEPLVAPPKPGPLIPTALPTSIPSTIPVTAVPTLPPYSPTRAPTVQPFPAAISVQQRFNLRELAGIGHDPYSVAVLGDQVYVVNTATDNVAVIKGDRVVKYIAVGAHPGAIAVDPVQKRVFIANDDDKTVSVLSNDAVVKTIGVGDRIGSMLFFEGRLYIGLENSGKILAVDSNSLQSWTSITVPNSFGIINMAGDTSTHRIYADVYQKVAVIDPVYYKVITTLETKESYYTLVAYPEKNLILTDYYDSNTSSDFLVAYDAATGAERGRVPIGSDARGAVMSADGTRVYVANAYTNNVSVVDPRDMSLVATIPVGSSPRSVALDEAAHRLYVVNQDSDSVNVIDVDKLAVTAAIPVSIIATAVLGSESTGRVYITSASTDSVFVIQGGKILKEIGVGHNPVDLARDDQSGRILVANAADRTLSIINEQDLTVQSTQPITRFLTTVAVDQAHSRVFAEDMVLDLKTLAPTGRLLMKGATVGSQIEPDWIRVNPGNGRIYAVAWNGTPGSNSRSVTYSVDGDTLNQRATLGSYGNATAVALDPGTNRVFIASTHPIVYSNVLAVYDANDKEVLSLPLRSRTAAMVYNPQTHHLFLSYATSYASSYGPTPTPADDQIEVFDTVSFGIVATLTVPKPGKMGLLGNSIYVANREDGSVTVIQDTTMPIPPSPTPTRTPTPWPSYTPTSQSQRIGATATAVAGATATPPCAFQTSQVFMQKVSVTALVKLGCATEQMRSVNFAAQPFERGMMFWREDEKRIYVLFNDDTWQAFDDTWTEGMPEDSCPSFPVAGGLVKPRRGFGKVWCSSSNLSGKLGGATMGEFGLFSAPVQRFQRGLIFGGDAGQVFTLVSNGKWE